MGATPSSATTGTLMPPDQMTGFTQGHETIIAAPLCGVYREGVNNLLNHTLPVVGTCGNTKQVWGLTVTRLDLWSTLEAYVSSSG